MESLNFEYLKQKNEELAVLGAFAEQYVHSDPASALVKLRLFGEILTTDFLFHNEILPYPQESFVDMLYTMQNQKLVPPVVLDMLHLLRKMETVQPTARQVELLRKCYFGSQNRF
ncbi:MAG: hypothetical protein H7A34_01790 [bacterium]|nr:hypothetical protein [bacterium]